jgi:hypothetical protein
LDIGISVVTVLIMSVVNRLATMSLKSRSGWGECDFFKIFVNYLRRFIQKLEVGKNR